MARIEQEALDVLACEFALRPVGAPGPDEIRPHVRGVERRAGEIIIEFDSASIDTVSAFVAAERACCERISRSPSPLHSWVKSLGLGPKRRLPLRPSALLTFDFRRREPPAVGGFVASRANFWHTRASDQT